MGVDISGTLPGLLEARGMTQDDLAGATGIRRTDINAIARGRRKPGPGVLQRIADGLGVSVIELAPSSEPDQRALDYGARLEELEAVVNRLGPDLAQVVRRVRALERQVRPSKPQAGSH